MNLVYRWDWHREGFFDWEGDDLLQVFWMGQRKALCRSSDVMVHTDDEPAVRAWLEDRARTLVAMWSPLSLVASSPVGGEQ